MNKIDTISVKVRLYNPEKDQRSYFKTYKIPLEEGWTVLNLLNYIYRNIDSSIAYYSSCRVGKCGGCTIKVNGKTKLACTTMVEGSEIVLEAVDGHQVIKDLMVER